jgi:hypothetical protein
MIPLPSCYVFSSLVHIHVDGCKNAQRSVCYPPLRALDPLLIKGGSTWMFPNDGEIFLYQDGRLCEGLVTTKRMLLLLKLMLVVR